MTPPLVNLLAVAASIESGSSVTFREAGFKGLFLGVYKGEKGIMTSALMREQVTEDCEKFAIQPLATDVVTARLVMCMQTLQAGTNRDGKGTADALAFKLTNRNVTANVDRFSKKHMLLDDVKARTAMRTRSLRAETTSGEATVDISLMLEKGVMVVVQVSFGPYLWERFYIGYLRTGEGHTFLLRAALDEIVGALLVKEGMEKILEACGSGLTMSDSEQFNTPKVKIKFGRDFVAGRTIAPCKIDSGRTVGRAMAVFEVFDQKLTAVRTEKMMVKNMTGSDLETSFFDARDMELLKRETGMVGIGVLVIVAGVALVARLVVGLAVNNDVNDGIERMVKERLGLEYCESLLYGRVGSTVVQYGFERGQDRSDAASGSGCGSSQ